MSSKLKFYKLSVQDDDNEKVTQIISFSRNDDIYNYFNDNCDIQNCYGGMKYSTISESDVEKVVSDINDDIRSEEKRLSEYEKYAMRDPKYIDDILTMKERIEDLNRTLHYAEFIRMMVYQSNFLCSGNDKIVANIL